MDKIKLAHPRADVNGLDEARQAFLAAWIKFLASNPSRFYIAEELTDTTKAMIQIARFWK